MNARERQLLDELSRIRAQLWELAKTSGELGTPGAQVMSDGFHRAATHLAKAEHAARQTSRRKP